MGEKNVAYKISPSDYFPSQVSCLSQLGKAVKTIKRKLSPTQLCMFRKTCFGKLLDVQIVFNGPLIHQLLLRETYEENKDVISFILGGTIVTFSKREFDLITGLWHTGKQVELRLNNRLQELIFKDKVKMSVGELEQTFISACLLNDEDVVKFALVYFIELAMLGKERKICVDTTLFSIVDDWETFENYDWSSHLFKRTLKGLQNALKNRVLVYKEKVKANPIHTEKYCLLGFPHSLQVWAYETISSLSIRVAKRLNDSAIPRILQWTCSRSPSVQTLHEEIFYAQLMDVQQVLEMTENEKRAIDVIRGSIPSPLFPTDNIAHQGVEHLKVEPIVEKPIVDDVSMSFYGDDMPKKKEKRTKPKHKLKLKLKSIQNYFKCTAARMKVLEDDVKGLKEDMKLVISTLQHMETYLCKGQKVDEEHDLDSTMVGEKLVDSNTYSLTEVIETTDIGETSMEGLNEARGGPNEVELCDVCGDAGFADVAVACSRCKIACEHIYCMRAYLKNKPETWICETCQ